jgi:hypothetical protein
MDTDLSQGPVTVRMVSSGPSFEVYQAVQGQTKLGAVRFDWTKSGVILETVSGHAHALFAPLVLKRFNAALTATGRTTQLCDFWGITSYDSDFRLEHTRWGQRHRPMIDAIHILTQSKLVAMGVSVANLAMGGMFTSYTKRNDFNIAAQKLGFPANRPLPE